MTDNTGTDVRNKAGARIQVKICGLTQVAQASDCVQLGADLIGVVFDPGSPRCVERKQAGAIAAAVQPKAAAVGLFVDEAYQTVIDVVKDCGLAAVQLHGHESPEQVQRLRDAGLTVFKALFHAREPFLTRAADYDASAFLLECGSGRLPGGNARVWDWTAVQKVSRSRPLILAGGLDAGNLSRAVRLGRPDAVDVSSGVERLPGEKDMEKVAAFIDAARRIEIDYPIQQIREGELPC